MSPLEVLVWGVSAGGVLLLAGLTLAVLLAYRSWAAGFTLLFLVTSGASVLLLSGLFEFLLPSANPRLFLLAKLGLPLLSCAVSLTLLGRWSGASGRDRMVGLLIRLGRACLLLAALGLVAIALVRGPGLDQRLLQAAAVATFVGVVLGSLATARTALLGDRVAWIMLLACVCLAAGAAMLYAHAINPGEVDLLQQAVSAALMQIYFVIVCWLAFERDLEYRRIQRRLVASDELDPLTKLPQGAALMGHIERATRRSARLRRECAVIAISIKNLYAFNKEVGYAADREVSVALVARIRKLAGIHNAVGLYHAGCFVVVVAAVQTPTMLRTLGLRLAAGVRKPLNLSRRGDARPVFKPDVGVGVARLDGELSDASFALEEAEHLAAQARSFASRAAIRGQHDDETMAVEDYSFAPRKRRQTASGRDSITRY